jgi:hypothetical protein
LIEVPHGSGENVDHNVTQVQQHPS